MNSAPANAGTSPARHGAPESRRGLALGHRIAAIALAVATATAVGGCSSSLHDLQANPVFDAFSEYPIAEEQLNEGIFFAGTSNQVVRFYIIPADEGEAPLKVRSIIEDVATSDGKSARFSDDSGSGRATIDGDIVIVSCPPTPPTADSIPVPTGSTLVKISVQ